MSEFAQAALRLRQKQNQVSDPRPDPFKAAASRFKEERDKQDRSRLKSTFEATKDQSPEQTGAALRIADEKKLPVDTAKRNRERLESERNKPDADRIAKETPVLAQTLSDQDNAAAMQDDIDNLSWFERVWQDTAQGFQRGKDVTRVGDIGWSAIQGKATPEQLDTARELSQKPETDFELGFFSGIPGATAEALPLMATVMGRSLDEAAVGAGIGTAAGSTAFGVGVVPGFFGGTGAGFLAGNAVEAARIEAGNAYIEYTGFTDENGESLDEDTARGAAILTGAVNGTLEAYGFAKVLESVPGVGKVFGQFSRKGMRQILKQPTVRKSLARFGKTIGVVGAAEGITEALQEVSTILGGELSKALDEGEYEPIAFSEAIERVTQALEQGAQGGIGLGTPGATVQLGIDASNVRRAKQNQTFFKILGEKSKESKTTQRIPLRQREQVQKLRERYEGLDYVYVNPERLNTFFQAKEIDNETLQRDMPQTAEDLAEANISGNDVAIPMEEFITNIAPTQGYNDLVPDLKFDPSELSHREAEAVEQAQEEYEQLLTEQREEGGDTIAQNIREQLQEVGTEEGAADQQAQMWAAFFRTMGERTGKDPQELFESFNVQVQREQETEGIEGALNALRNDEIPGESNDPQVQKQRERLQELQSTLSEQGINLSEMDNQEALKALSDALSQGRVLEQSQVASKDQAQKSVESRGVSGDSLLDAMDLYDDLVEKGGQVDESGMVTLYHRTTLENAKRIQQEGQMTSREDRLFFGTRPEGQIEGYGDAVVAIKAPLEKLELNDVFSNEAHVSMKSGRPGTKIPVSLVSADPNVLFQKGAQQPRGRTLEQSVFHGTPHRFDRFSLDAIGTGEGAQAFGWGLYFAGKREIAEYYRDALAGLPAVKDALENEGVDNDQLATFIASDLQEKDGDTEAVAQNLDQLTNSMDRRSRSDALTAMNLLRNQPEKFQDASGNVVQADIPDDSELLDWDAPISEQPDKVKEAIEQVRDVYRDQTNALEGDMRGSQLYQILSSDNLAGSQRRASIDLQAAGITGLRYLDATSRNMTFELRHPQGGIVEFPTEAEAREFQQRNPEYELVRDPTRNYVIWDENAVTVEAVNDELRQARQLEQQGGQQPRGRIQFPNLENNPERWFKITLTGRANLSTFLHESGHFFLEAFRDMARQENTPQEIKDDWERIKKFLDIKGDEIPTEAHEKWARGWEAYTMEGQAPSLQLAEAFERFKTWLIAIYRNFRQLDVELDDDIRDVMDRMLATRREIEEARQAQGYVPAFDSADSAGMTQAEFESYTRLHERAMREAENELDRRVMAEVKRRRTEEYRRRRDEIRTEVEQEVEQMPVYRAEAFLRRGVVPEDLDIPESMQGKKLNKQALQDMYPDRDILKPMSFTYVANGGIHPNMLAPYFGFETGREMVDAISAQPRRKEFIDNEVKKRLNMEADDPMLDGSIAEEAIKAAHNDKRGRFLLSEVNALGKRVGAERISQTQVIQMAARRRVAELRHMDLRPHRYRQAEIRHAKAAQRAIGEQDYAAAHQAKRQQLLNHYLYREAVAAREEVESAREYLRRFDEQKTRQRIGKAGPEYLEQIDTLLANTEFRKTTLRRIKQRGTLANWIKEQEAEGNVVAIPEWLRDESQTTNWRQMSVGEVKGLRDAVKNIEALARLKNKLQYAKEARDFEEAIETVIGQTEANAPKLQEEINQNPNWWEQRKETIKSFNASLTKMEFLARWMDGGEAGPAHELIFQPFVDAQEAEYEMLRTLGKDIMAPLRDMSKEQRARLNQSVYVPQLGRRMLVKDLLVAALNLGNEGNKEKLLQGYGWTEQSLMSALDEHLKVEDWEMVQQLWDSIDKLWPHMAEIHRKHTGLEPPKVEAMPVETKHGTFRGGYFPVVYDRRRSHQAEINEQKGNLFENNFLRATVDRGFTEQRTKFYAPIQLSLDVIPAHVTDVIHYVTHYEAVQAVEKLTSNARVRKAITESFGKEQYQEIRPWLQSIANNGKPTEFLKGVDDVFRHVRTGMTVYAMGFKFTTGIAQVFGLATTLDELGPGYTARGIRRFLTHPSKTWQFANENSGEIRFATRTFDRDVKAQLDKAMGQRNVPQEVINFALAHIGYIQKSINVMTWTGAYEKAIDQGKSHRDAVRQAELSVRTSQGSGAVKDLPKIMRGTEMQRSLVMFYTYFSTLYNRFQDVARDTKGVKDIPRFAARWSYLAILPIMLDAFVLGRGPDESEDESWTEWFLLQNVLYPLTSVPLARDFADGALGKYGYDISPVASALGDIAGTTGDIYEAIVKGDDLPPSFPKKLSASLGLILRLPTGQLWNTLEWAEAFVDGDLNNPFREFFQGVDKED